MAAPKCPKCEHEFFSASSVEAIGLKQRVTVIHCSRCGTAIGTMDSESMNEAFSQIQEKLEDMEFKLGYLIK